MKLTTEQIEYVSITSNLLNYQNGHELPVEFTDPHGYCMEEIWEKDLNFFIK
jgi:hypothetical protein